VISTAGDGRPRIRKGEVIIEMLLVLIVVLNIRRFYVG